MIGRHVTLPTLGHDIHRVHMSDRQGVGMTAVPSGARPEADHRRWACGVLAVLGAFAVVLALVNPIGGPSADIRAVATVAFMLLGPGWAVAGFLRSVSPALSWSVAAGVGCAVGGLGGEAMLLLGVWHPVGALYVLAAVCVPLLVRHAVTAR